jgi:hypothetical protein
MHHLDLIWALDVSSLSSRLGTAVTHAGMKEEHAMTCPMTYYLEPQKNTTTLKSNLV